jgi:Flp pilus assembly protein TadG
VLIALMLTVLIGMAAIAIDGARAYALRRDLQAAVDSAALAAADKLQQGGGYAAAEQAASTIFASNLRLYNAPSCTASGAPGPAPFTVTCTYSDGTVLTEVVQAIGPQGSQFTISATRTLQLQFARILTNGSSPTLSATSTGNVNNLLYTPTIAALNQAGCGGAGGTAIQVNGSGTLQISGDVVSNGTITVSNGSVRVAGDTYARCQASVPAVSNACYPSGASTPCSYPDVAGATRSGFRLADPNFPAPTMIGGSQGLPNANVVLRPGVYSALPFLNGTHCWFLSGGVYEFQSGLVNWGDFMSNELKPPDEPNVADNTQRAANQFWNTNGVNCSGAFQVSKVSGPGSIQTGRWSFVVTSMRTDTYNGVTYMRESAPSMCNQVNLNNHFDAVQLDVSNVPGATSYNIYASPPGNGCAGPFGLATNLPVSGPVLNTNTNPCPNFSGAGCTLGHESITLSAELAAPFAPNAAASPGTTGAYPPDGETAPIEGGLPNQNPARGPGSRGDRANENNCETIAPSYASCPAPITPGAVELYFPAGGCLVTGNSADTYLFSGYQYNWVMVFEPGPGSPPANNCANVLGAAGNTAFIGLVYAPSAYIGVISPDIFEAIGTGGLIADSLGFSGSLPGLTYSSMYAPVPPASRLTN